MAARRDGNIPVAVMRRDLTEEIFRVADSQSFEKTALETFRLQAAECPVYREYLQLLGTDVGSISDILSVPFMPVSFFRDHNVFTGEGAPERIFTSSGTAGMRRSSHAVRSLALYNESLERTFRLFYGDPAGYAIMGLLPSYLEREGSSLIYMVNRLMTLSGNSYGGFFLDEHEALLKAIDRARLARLRVMLIGVTFALLDMAESHPADLSDAIIMETGGMKGRRREMIRDEVHEIIREAFGVTTVHSEYGMTELLSQAYSAGGGLFRTPPWMKVLIRDSHDPMSHSVAAGASGGISVIDLANIWSCSFIATADLGRMHGEGLFEVQGRFDEADLRGCNLLVS
ncbi:MAG: acyltransferase [Bacteroidales bacterium]|nr:acyltransferase [Bacteroidales bacterium]MDT8373785.1 acyltransferase [Bacteroidales bacterium]